MQHASTALVVAVFALALAQVFGAEYVGSPVLRNKFHDTVTVAGAAGITVNFTFDNAAACSTKPAGSNGKASCKFTPSVTTLGPHTLGWSASDGTSGSQSVILYEFPAGGAFVVGDVTALNAQNGAVTFFGDNWRASQQFSGVYSGNAKHFIGWIDDDRGSEVFHLNGWCAALWKHGGNDAPKTLPSYMGVIFASKVEHVWGSWFGDIRGVAVLTNIKYTPSVHKVDGSGTGNVVGHERTWISLRDDFSCQDCTTCTSSQYQTPKGACSTFADTQCAACDATCKTCSGAGPSACTSCVAGSYVNAQGQCQTCPSTCATCQLVGSNVQCLTCAAGFQGPDANGVCTVKPTCTGAKPDGSGTTSDGAPAGQCVSCAGCPSGRFVSAACTPTKQTQCAACDPTCGNCVAPGDANSCTSCNPNIPAVLSIPGNGNTGTCIPCTANCLTCIDGSSTGCTFCNYGCTQTPFNSVTFICSNCPAPATQVPAAIEGGLTAETVTHTVVPAVLVPIGLAIIAASWLICFRSRKQAPVKTQRPSSSKAVDDGSSHGLKEEGVAVNVHASVNTPRA